ncbi:Hypothetical protein A7982_08781 [Minicystis rosea]|nr:Hypothetical protein A7982_08781 [Minicystis rosea]
MPNPPASKTERTFCATCGFPVRGSRCEACGAAPEPAHDRDVDADSPTKQTQFRPFAVDLDADVVGLERAIDAYRSKDTARFVEQLVFAEGAGSARTSPQTDGSGWVVTVRGGLVFVTLRLSSDEIALESPVARLPTRQRLPALRLALELCGREAASSRVCLRGDLLILRFAARASLITPALLRHHLREMGHLASRYSGLFVVGLDALPALADDIRSSAGFEVLGRPKKVQVLGGGKVRPSIPPPVSPFAAQAERSRNDLERSRNDLERSRNDLERSRGDNASPIFPQPPRVPVIPSPRSRRDDDAPAESQGEIPAVLSPMFSSSSTPPSSDDRKRRSTPLREAEPESTARKAEPPVQSSARAGDSNPSLSASDRLCMLLRQAQSMASLTLEERPATLAWLVRSTVFRAVYDFKDTLPDAVAHLYRCTGIGKDMPAARASQSGLPATEPALLVMERVIVARAAVAKEKPLALEPMVSAAQAKEHVARYLSEIDKAPADPGLRHFLGLGALTELLVRTKLPPQTDQRLRDIVAHAQREGAKPTSIDLMMTALQRINS